MTHQYTPETQALLAAALAGDVCPECGAANHTEHFDDCVKHPENDVVARAKSALEGVSRAPWRMGNRRLPDVVHTPSGCLWHPDLGFINNVNDGQFIAAARTLVPELIAALDRANRDVTMLTKQLDALHDTDIGELATRNDEQAAEILTLKAQLAALGVTSC